MCVYVHMHGTEVRGQLWAVGSLLAPCIQAGFLLCYVLLFWLFEGPATQLPNKSHTVLLLVMNARP